MLYKFELSHEDIETTKNICCIKGEDTVDHNEVILRLKKFHSMIRQGQAGLKL